MKIRTHKWKWKSLSSVRLFATPWAILWNSPGQNTGVGSLSLLQGIFPTRESKSDLPHFRWILYQLSHKGSSRILEWVACSFSWGTSWSRNWTGVSWIVFTNWALREACHCSVTAKLPWKFRDSKVFLPAKLSEAILLETDILLRGRYLGFGITEM